MRWLRRGRVPTPSCRAAPGSTRPTPRPGSPPGAGRGRLLRLPHRPQARRVLALVRHLDQTGTVGERGHGDLELALQQRAVAYDVGGQFGDEQYRVLQRRIPRPVPPVGQVVPDPAPGETYRRRMPGQPEGVASQHVCSSPRAHLRHMVQRRVAPWHHRADVKAARSRQIRVRRQGSDGTSRLRWDVRAQVGRQIQLRLQSRNRPVPSDRYWPPPTSSLVTTYSLACHSGITGTSRATASCSERKSFVASLRSAYC